ncbi:heme-degrading domain-containing protein [Rathayibacter sp. YIM 133350]|uniref:heme-degrading domain-containing protein n=1 Tax=Rathayibacter sp. YIM 133350 TaxID=3131992 RepID=UPI00307CD962
MTDTTYYEQLLAEEAELVVTDFTLEDAWALGSRMRAAALDAGMPVAIGIVLGQQRVFHSALPGSSADNDDWLERKTRVALRFGRASMAVGESFRVGGKTFEEAARLDPSTYAAHGGVVPVRLAGGVVIGAVGVSGLPQREDHAFVVEHLRAFIADKG